MELKVQHLEESPLLRRITTRLIRNKQHPLASLPHRYIIALLPRKTNAQFLLRTVNKRNTIRVLERDLRDGQIRVDCHDGGPVVALGVVERGVCAWDEVG